MVRSTGGRLGNIGILERTWVVRMFPLVEQLDVSEPIHRARYFNNQIVSGTRLERNAARRSRVRVECDIIDGKRG
jgi:hypothetical protein